MRELVGVILLTYLVLLAAQPGQCAEVPGVQESIEQGDLFLDDDKVAYAIQAYRQAIKRDPDSAEAHQRLGRALSLSGDLEAALYESSRATQLDPESATAHATRGRILGMMHRYRESAAEEFMSLRLEPDNPSAYLTLGLALASLGDFDDAVGAIYEAIRLDPDNVSAYVNLGAVLGRKGDYKSAVLVYRRALELNPNSVATRLGLGAALGKTGDIDGQIREFRAAVELAPNSDNAHGKLGWALYKHGEFDGAFKEGCITNWIRLQRFGPQYLRMFTYVWAGVFLLFGAIFAIIFIGSKLIPQPDEILIKSYFLTFFEDRPGRFVVTNKRVVWIPEGFSKWFGAKDISLDRNLIREIDSLVAGNQGRLTFSMTEGTVHEFTMPLFVFRPLRNQLDKLGERARMKLTGPWVVPTEVQEAIASGVGATDAGADPIGAVPVTSGVSAAASATPSEDFDEDEQRDTRTKWERIRKPTKVYTFVNGKLVEDESGDEFSARKEAPVEEQVGKFNWDQDDVVAESEDTQPKAELAAEGPEEPAKEISSTESEAVAGREETAEEGPEQTAQEEAIAESAEPPAKQDESAGEEPERAPQAASVTESLVPTVEEASTDDSEQPSTEESLSKQDPESPGPSPENPESTGSSGTEEPKK